MIRHTNTIRLINEEKQNHPFPVKKNREVMHQPIGLFLPNYEWNGTIEIKVLRGVFSFRDFLISYFPRTSLLNLCEDDNQSMSFSSEINIRKFWSVQSLDADHIKSGKAYFKRCQKIHGVNSPL